MSCQPTNRPWLAALTGAAVTLLVIFVASFACGLFLAVFSMEGRTEESDFLTAGLIVAVLGTIGFGTPLAVITGSVRWFECRRRCRNQESQPALGHFDAAAPSHSSYRVGPISEPSSATSDLSSSAAPK